jgi:hypothetical protein
LKSIFFCFFAIIQWWNGDDYEEPWWSSNMVGECEVNFRLLCFLLCAFYWGVYYVVNVHVIWWHDFVTFILSCVGHWMTFMFMSLLLAMCTFVVNVIFISFSIVDILFCKIFLDLTFLSWLVDYAFPSCLVDFSFLN